MAVGDVHDAPHGVDWSCGNSQHDLPRGYYPRKADGSVDQATRLRWVDATPDDPEDNTGWFVEMPREAGFGYFHGKPGHAGIEDVPAGPVAPLEAEAAGEASVDGGFARVVKALKINYLLGKK